MVNVALFVKLKNVAQGKWAVAVYKRVQLEDTSCSCNYTGTAPVATGIQDQLMFCCDCTVHSTETYPVSCNYTGTAGVAATTQGKLLYLQLHRESSCTCNYTGKAPVPATTQGQAPVE
jgi:hypothetical protein